MPRFRYIPNLGRRNCTRNLIQVWIEGTEQSLHRGFEERFACSRVGTVVASSSQRTAQTMMRIERPPCPNPEALKTDYKAFENERARVDASQGKCMYCESLVTTTSHVDHVCFASLVRTKRACTRQNRSKYAKLRNWHMIQTKNLPFSRPNFTSHTFVEAVL